MSRRNPIEDIDWRVRVATPIVSDTIDDDGNVLYQKGTPVTVSTFTKHNDREIGFDNPSATALFLNQSKKAFDHAINIHPFMRDWPPEGKNPTAMVYDYIEEMCSSIVFAYVAIEAFANEEIPENYVYEAERENDSGIFVVQHLGKDKIERMVSLSEKLSTILPEVFEIESPKGSTAWEGFVQLRRLRDRIIHLKTKDRDYSKHGDMYPDSIWKDLLNPDQRDYPLIAKSIILSFKSDTSYHWLEYCPF